MTETIELHATRCAICGTEGNAVELYPANFDFAAFNADIFSARRLPDGLHYRLVTCATCGLVRSDPVASTETLARLYERSVVTYGDEVPDLRYTYGRYLSRLAHFSSRRESLLEIGCGNGFFLLEALAQGYTDVRGVEPSSSAIAQADPQVRSQIVCDLMRPGLFAPDTFDVVCLFQVFDHVPEPGAVLDECLRVLRPGGLLLCLNHNVTALSARLMKERSPIIDIEHTYLYSPPTISRMASDHGFQIGEVGSVYNRYALRYLVRLLPLPSGLKQSLLKLLASSLLGGVRVSVPLGNLYMIARKPS